MRDREESPYDEDYGSRRRDKSYDDYSRSSRYRSRSRSRSGRRRSRTRSGERRYSRSYRSRSRSPTSSRGRDKYNDNPEPCRCLGIFGMSLYTTERELERVLSKYGPLEKINVVKDAKTDRSRGFAFVYFESLEDAKVAKEACNGIELDGRKIRCDYSITKRAHTPTPGIYMGRPTFSEKRPRRRSPGYRRSPSYDRDYYSRRSRSRSYSPRRY